MSHNTFGVGTVAAATADAGLLAAAAWPACA